MEPIRAAIVGCGNISGQYFKGCAPFGRYVRVAACGDRSADRAAARAAEFNVSARPVADILADPDIQLVINLTTPGAHTEVNLAAVAAGKHVYCEKPLAVERADAERVLAAAESANVRVGCAPDTFLGGGIQTARALIDAGAIGQPVAAVAFLTCRGHERWHPDPEFYYQRGGGPMLDMGPYYLTALVNLLGPVARVAGATRISFPDRVIESQPKAGQRIVVQTPTHVAGVMDFVAGPVGTIVTSFDVWSAHLPRIEVYGSDGSLSVPDPNTFGGPVRLVRGGEKEWVEQPHTHSVEVGRGVGPADMARAIAAGRPHRAAGTLAAHVLEVMLAFERSSESGRHVAIERQCDRPAALPPGMPLGELD